MRSICIFHEALIRFPLVGVQVMMFAEHRAENSPFLDIDLGRHNQGETFLGTRPPLSCKVCTALVKEMLQIWK